MKNSKQKLYFRYDKRMKAFTADTKFPRNSNADLYFILDVFNYKHLNPEIYDNKSLIQHLEERGYDPTTIKFSIEVK